MGKASGYLSGGLWIGLLAILAACGEVGGAGQCNGVEDSGVCLTVVSIQPFEESGESSDVDAFQTIDCDGDPATFDPEPVTKHQASITISADLMTIATVPPAPAFVTITGYTIEYDPSSTNLIPAPALSSQVFSQTIRVDTETSVTEDIEMVPIQTKIQYGELGGDPRPSIYNVIYTFEGKTQFNEDVLLRGTTSASIGDFNNC